MSSDHPTLLTPEALPFTSGVTTYYDTLVPGAAWAEPRIYIRLALDDSGIELLAMVDTGAPWCIIEPHLAEPILDRLEELPKTVTISTRLGRFDGKLHRATVRLMADEGEGLTVDTTFFLSQDWPGGNFVGYLGFLDRIRFAVDPKVNRFYFGSLR